MISKEQRGKYLEKLAHSSIGTALKDEFEELIGVLTDSRNYSKADFEIEGKASVKAAAILQKILRDLELYKKPKKEVKKTSYV